MARDDAETESLVPRSRDTWPMPRVSPTSGDRSPVDSANDVSSIMSEKCHVKFDFDHSIDDISAFESDITHYRQSKVWLKWRPQAI